MRSQKPRGVRISIPQCERHSARLCTQGQQKPSPAGHRLPAWVLLVATEASRPPVFCHGTGRTALVRDKLFDPSTPGTFIYTSILCLQQLGHFPHYSSMWYHNMGCKCPTILLKSKRRGCKLVQPDWEATGHHTSGTRKTLITFKLRNRISVRVP